MAAQYDLYRLQDGQLVVVVQSDLLDQLHTRVVAPLMPRGVVGRVLETLNPVIAIGEDAYLLMPQLAATLTRAEMGERIGSLAPQHDRIVRALDALMSGI